MHICKKGYDENKHGRISNITLRNKLKQGHNALHFTFTGVSSTMNSYLEHMGNMASVLKETGTTYPSRAPMSPPRDLVVSVLLILLVFGVVFCLSSSCVLCTQYDCPFLIAPSVFSNIYQNECEISSDLQVNVTLYTTNATSGHLCRFDTIQCIFLFPRCWVIDRMPHTSYNLLWSNSYSI